MSALTLHQSLVQELYSAAHGLWRVKANGYINHRFVFDFAQEHRLNLTSEDIAKIASAITVATTEREWSGEAVVETLQRISPHLFKGFVRTPLF